MRTNRNRICVINDPGVLEKKYNNYLFISTTVNNKKTGFSLIFFKVFFNKEPKVKKKIDRSCVVDTI